jgi:hypothetical protein
LTRDEVGDLSNPDADLMRSEFKELPGTDGDGVDVAVLPSADLVNTLHYQCDFMGPRIYGREPQYYGTTNEMADAWIHWFHDFRRRQLVIKRVRPPPPKADEDQKQALALASLILDAMQEAARWELPTAVIWDPCNTTQRALKVLEELFAVKVESGERVGKSITSVRWRDGDVSKKVALQMNEFYAWS